MTDPIRDEIRTALHAVSLGERVACDYHARPKTIEPDEPGMFEAIKLIDHPQLQLDQWPDGWVLDAARCHDHVVSEIVAPTRGFEEALVRIPLAESNGVVSVETPEIDDVRVLDFSPGTEGLHPLVLDQQFVNASEPGDMGLSRWTRVIGMRNAEPPEPLRARLETLIDQSPETPFDNDGE